MILCGMLDLCRLIVALVIDLFRPRAATTSLHLDVLRDLKRIHSHICSVAYPVLEEAGELPAAQIAESDPITLAGPTVRPSTQ
jgi:hypothetical protein